VTVVAPEVAELIADTLESEIDAEGIVRCGLHQIRVTGNQQWWAGVELLAERRRITVEVKADENVVVLRAGAGSPSIAPRQ
jgi:hypothetical protein